MVDFERDTDAGRPINNNTLRFGLDLLIFHALLDDNWIFLRFDKPGSVFQIKYDPSPRRQRLRVQFKSQNRDLSGVASKQRVWCVR